jgi:hypothetical protein
MAEWFGVRCVFADPEGTYEERVTLWQADSFDEAVLLAESEATEYAADVGSVFLGFAQAYVMAEPPGNGVEVFSLLRDSDLDPDEYLDRFFDTGYEREAALDDDDDDDDDDDEDDDDDGEDGD